jgi:hypothetical protein
LEEEQSVKGQVVRAQFYLIYESFKPVNLIAGTLNDIANSPLLFKNITGIGLGLLTGTLSKTLFIGESGSKIKSIIGTVMQYGITNFVANHSGLLKVLGKSLFMNLVSKKGLKSNMP